MLGPIVFWKIELMLRWRGHSRCLYIDRKKKDFDCTYASNSIYSHFSLYCTQHRRAAFNCVLIDEAGQCTEPDVLIPLQYGTSKLILVGDQNQLPATVLSQKASRYNFGQSLFERIILSLGQYRTNCSDTSRGKFVICVIDVSNSKFQLSLILFLSLSKNVKNLLEVL